MAIADQAYAHLPAAMADGRFTAATLDASVRRVLEAKLRMGLFDEPFVDEERAQAMLNDPAHHPERGEVARRVFSRANFLRAWNRSKLTVYLIYPEGSPLPPDLFGHWDSTPPSRTGQ